MSRAQLEHEFTAADRRIAADHAREELAIRHAGVNVDNNLLLARARRSDAATVAGMAAHIAGYGRLK